jgi:photosystem II stability/assembly factor-like uncharacterized protein
MPNRRRIVTPAALVLLLLVLAACGRSAPPAPPAPPTPVPLIVDLGPTPPPDPFTIAPATTPDFRLRRDDREGFGRRRRAVELGLSDPGADVPRGLLAAAYEQRARYEPVGGEWLSAGPAPIDGVYLPQGRIVGSGRINGLAVDPRDSDTVYAAAAAGGLWKTTDGGRSWRSLGDRLQPLFYGGVVLDPADPDRVYVPLGVFDGTEAALYGFLANGILRSDDAGASWTLLGAETFNGGAVTALVIAPDGTLYASSGQRGVRRAPPNQVEYGIFRSTDRGASWERLAACSDYASCEADPDAGLQPLQGGFMDLDLGAGGALYATLCNFDCYGTQLLRSRDGGASWEALDYGNVLRDFARRAKVDVLTTGDRAGTPFVEGLELAVAPSDPRVLLAGGGLYIESNGTEMPWSFAMRSTDGGDSWEWLPEAGDYCSSTGSSAQCTYDNVVEIDPTDADVMYLGGSLTVYGRSYHWVRVIRRSTDGGDSWVDLTPGDREETTIHPDAHALAFDPDDPARVWIGTDGGVARTEDALAGEVVWENLSEGLSTLLIVDIGLHPTDPDYILAGLQDNGNAFTTDGGQTWEGASSGDAGYSAVDPFEPEIVYSEYLTYFFTRNEEGGAGDWSAWGGRRGDGYVNGLETADNWYAYAPFVVDPHNEGVIYFASNRVYRTEDRGDRWEIASRFLTRWTIRTLALAPSDPDTLYAGTSDGLVWVTRDGAESWENVTGHFPPRTVNRIAVDPRDPDTAVAVFGGFDRTTMIKGQIFRTTDGGASWREISYNLPDAPLTAVVIDGRPKSAGVYAGGATGVWVLPDGASEWRPFGTGMPNALISDLELNPDTGILAAATFGRSVWVLRLP